MTLPYKGARFPGPLGTSTGTLGGRIPGPLNFQQVEVKGGATKKIKTVEMPPPWNNSTIKRVRSVDWPLSKDAPATEDVKQGGMANCPVAAILAALAHTPVGRKRLDGMVTEYTNAPTKTVLADDTVAKLNEPTKDDPDYKPQGREVLSNRYFTVSFWKGEIPDTFYVEYSDSDSIDMVFMGSRPNKNRVLWPSVIEKACAFHFGGYDEMGKYKNHPANEFWELIIGKKPQDVVAIKDSTDLDKIRDLARAAPTVPTIAASKEPGQTEFGKVTPDHGYAVLGLKGASIELYNPAEPKTISLSAEEVRRNYQAILYGNP
jgi:hypothetical protein